MSSKREGTGNIYEVNPDVREWCTFLSTHIAHLYIKMLPQSYIVSCTAHAWWLMSDRSPPIFSRTTPYGYMSCVVVVAAATVLLF